MKENFQRIMRSLSLFFTLAMISPALAQEAVKMPRLAILTSGGPERDAARYAGVRQALRERGYTEA
jgi:hypothetical protein